MRSFDRTVIHFITGFETKNVTSFFIVLTTIATKYYEYLFLALFAVIFLLFLRRMLEPVMLAVTLIGVRYGNHLLKDWFGRERPASHPLIEAGGYSFPSGHAMISIAFFGMAAYLIISVIKERVIVKRWIAIVTALFILLVGISRIYLGVHYPSDILAGFAVGGIWLLACIGIYDFFAKKRIKVLL